MTPVARANAPMTATAAIAVSGPAWPIHVAGRGIRPGIVMRTLGW